MSYAAWIFDLDGTLTVPMHDFVGFKRSHGLPVELDILSGIALQPEGRRAALHQAVRDWEHDLVEHARPAPGAVDLLAAIGAPVGVVTRNTRTAALRTLEVIGLRDRFDDACILGRSCATPKPAPDALLRLLEGWRLPAGDAVMVGDYVDDLRAGRAAGTATVWVDHRGGKAPLEADRVVRSLEELVVAS